MPKEQSNARRGRHPVRLADVGLVVRIKRAQGEAGVAMIYKVASIAMLSRCHCSGCYETLGCSGIKCPSRAHCKHFAPGKIFDVPLHHASNFIFYRSASHSETISGPGRVCAFPG